MEDLFFKAIQQIFKLFIKLEYYRVCFLHDYMILKTPLKWI